MDETSLARIDQKLDDLKEMFIKYEAKLEKHLDDDLVFQREIMSNSPSSILSRLLAIETEKKTIDAAMKYLWLIVVGLVVAMFERYIRNGF